MKRTSIFISDELMQMLKAESEKTGAPVAELIRRAIKKTYSVATETKEVAK